MPICDSYSLFPFLQVDRQMMQTLRVENLNPQYPHNCAGYVTFPIGDLPRAYCRHIAEQQQLGAQRFREIPSAIAAATIFFFDPSGANLALANKGGAISMSYPMWPLRLAQ